MLSLKQFITSLNVPMTDGDGDSADGVVRTAMFGLEVAAVMLPSELLTEDRVSRMNALWDLLDEREALVIAVTRGKERRIVAFFGRQSHACPINRSRRQIRRSSS